MIIGVVFVSEPIVLAEMITFNLSIYLLNLIHECHWYDISYQEIGDQKVHDKINSSHIILKIVKVYHLLEGICYLDPLEKTCKS